MKKMGDGHKVKVEMSSHAAGWVRFLLPVIESIDEPVELLRDKKGSLIFHFNRVATQFEIGRLLRSGKNGRG